MIEPTHEFGYAFLEILQGARHKGTEADRRAGPGCRCADTSSPIRVCPRIVTADDLRLPARLYALRKSAAAGKPSGQTLDQIARLLADGDCDHARRLLDAAVEFPNGR